MDVDSLSGRAGVVYFVEWVQTRFMDGKGCQQVNMCFMISGEADGNVESEQLVSLVPTRRRKFRDRAPGLGG